MSVDSIERIPHFTGLTTGKGFNYCSGLNQGHTE
jgi:hypothetical protein